MTNHSIIRILREAALLLKHEFNPADLRFVEINNRHYAKNEFGEFKNDLIEAGSKMRMLFLEQNIPAASLTDLVKDDNILVLVFHETPQELVPLLISCERKKIAITPLQENTQLSFGPDISQLTSLYSHANGVVTYILYPYKNLVSDYAYEGDVVPEPMSPVRRFFRLLSTERKDILYILFYSIVVGLIGLILPVGIQNTVELISGGVFFSSVYLLIAAVILGVLFTGILQIIQIGLVEHLQRRVFTKAAIEFAFRIPRIRMESILNNYAPELVNRFFDVITLQKGLPKMLIDLSSAAIQIFFGLILLSLYHPFFVFFSVILVFVLFLIFWLTGANGLTSSINESKYKYKVVQWLEELARSINSFKLAGNTDLPIRRTDNMVNN